MASLAVKYRPKTFEEMLGQKSIIKILKRQIELKQYTNCYIFAGSSGIGKTTACRAFARLINENKGEPIEIDAASNNGVDSVREIIDSANTRALDAEYKVFIIDECHALSSSAWQAFLKCIEEPPKYTIFMFCTTNPEKIPDTIKNRCMRFNLSKISTPEIEKRLEYICEQEGYTNYKEACDYLSKLASGGARDAIALLEKAANYNTDLSIENVLECIGDFSYDELFNLTGAVLNQNQARVLTVIEEYYNSGKDIKRFIESYIEFLLNLCKYILFSDMNCTSLPLSLKNRCDAYSRVPNVLTVTNFMLENMIDIKQAIKNDSNAKNTVEIYFIKLIKDCVKILEAE